MYMWHANHSTLLFHGLKSHNNSGLTRPHIENTKSLYTHGLERHIKFLIVDDEEGSPRFKSDDTWNHVHKQW